MDLSHRKAPHLLRTSLLLAFACVALLGLGATRRQEAPRAPHQSIDPQFYGYWSLNVQKSEYGKGPPPRMGQVNWGEHGWTFALVTADGRLYADGVSTDQTCHLIGFFSADTCEIEIVSPRHIRFILREGKAIRRVGDIELLDDGTTRTTHRITPAQGPAYVDRTIWEKVR